MAKYHRTQALAPDGSWYGLDESTGKWEQITEVPQEPILPYGGGDSAPLSYLGSPASDISTQQVQLYTTYLDRSQGFVVKTTCLAAVAGMMAGIAAITLLSVPILSLSLLMWVWGSFAVVWLLSFVWSELISADGVSFINAVLGWRYMFREQQERHAYYRREERRRYGGNDE